MRGLPLWDAHLLAPLLDRRPWVAGANGVSKDDRVTQGLALL
jgi:hypothetical protein